ncbi:hypothetical protein [Burkholderia metallica]|uniref:hypothetical protein n=1 Tax=Burkholderia metallica TaxID=488729 RepID=UPI0015758D01|nr:hypothetical protein [Burkholderia metallica]NTZ06370.1 hypothetical protein [Burkholderia metallica]
MAYSIEIGKMIDYSSTSLKNFHCYVYEWVDNLNFCLPIQEVFLDGWVDYDVEARGKFLAHGWSGDGRVELMWIPPFVLGPILMDGVDEYLRVVGEGWKNGLILWHVKQKEDGLSFILSPVKLNIPDIGIE